MPGTAHARENTLRDHWEIGNLVAGLAHAQDDKDWQRFPELFADRVTLDLSGRSGEPAENLLVGDLTALARTALDGFACTHHATSDLLVQVTGDTATCRAHVIAYHHVPADGVDFCVMRGFWRLGLSRPDGRWVIHHWAVVRTAPWEGDPDQYRIARERNEQRNPASAGPTV